MKKILAGVLATFVALAACETIQPDDVTGDSSSIADSFVFTASLGEGTRTSMKYDGYGYNIVWSEGDQIIIWDSLAFCGGYIDDKYEVCKLAAGAGTPNGEFLGSIQADSYVALYCNNYRYPYEGYPLIDLPILQSPKKSDGVLLDDISDYQYPMMAISDSRNLEFHNLCSILRVGVTGNGEIVNSITITSKKGEALSGTAKIISLEDYNLLEFTDANNSLVYRCYETLTATPQVFNIVIPAQHYSEGLEIEVFTNQGSMTVSIEEPLTICRSRFYDIDIDFQVDPMPDGLYLVSRRRASELTPANARDYALVETQNGRYEKFLLMCKDDLHTLECWKGGKMTEYTAYDIVDKELDSGYQYRWASLVSGDAGKYYIVSPFSDGLVNVVLNMDSESSSLHYVALLPVRWNLRGTFNAWGMKDMIPYFYSSTIVEFYVSSVIFDTDNAAFKFDYSGEWSIVLDDGYKCVTNLGADGQDMIFDGPNITVPERGIYNISLFSILTEGSVSGEFGYEIEKIGDVPECDYSKCQLELVGTSVAEGYPDSSSWNWGNVLLASDDGYPFFWDLVYTWSWYSVYLYGSSDTTNGDAGFKIRSVGAQVVESVPYIDYGENGPEGCNIVVDNSGYYNVYFYIDANTGAMSHNIELVQ